MKDDFLTMSYRFSGYRWGTYLGTIFYGWNTSHVKFILELKQWDTIMLWFVLVNHLRRSYNIHLLHFNSVFSFYKV